MTETVARTRPISKAQRPTVALLFVALALVGLFAIVVLPRLPTAAASPVIVGQSLEADTYVDKSNPNTNYGSTSVLSVRYNTTYTVLLFNISSLTSFSDAWITLSAASGSSQVRHVEAVHGYDHSGWLESTLTWNSFQPGEMTAAIATEDVGLNNWTTWHVTEYLRQHVGKKFIGFVIKMPANVGVEQLWKSGETNQSPTLYVQYGSPQTTTTTTTTGCPSSPSGTYTTTPCCPTGSTSPCPTATPPTTTHHMDCYENGYMISCPPTTTTTATVTKSPEGTASTWGVLGTLIGLIGVVALRRKDA